MLPEGQLWTSLYSDTTLLYKYKNEVKVPILEMVDDVLGVVRSAYEALKCNSTISSFMELNHLKLAEKFFFLKRSYW